MKEDLKSIIQSHQDIMNELRETLWTIVNKQGGSITIEDRLSQVTEFVKVVSLNIDSDNVLMVTYFNENNLSDVFEIDSFSYDEVYGMLINVCRQLKLK